VEQVDGARKVTRTVCWLDAHAWIPLSSFVIGVICSAVA
jgi:hypothetical protein